MEVTEGRIRCVCHLDVVRGFSRYIIIVEKKQDEIILSCHVAVDHLVIKLIKKILILKFALCQAVEKLLCSALFLGLHREFHVDQVLPKASGQSLAEDFKIFEHLLFLKSLEHLREGCDLLLLRTYIAARDPGECVLPRGQLLFDL